MTADGGGRGRVSASRALSDDRPPSVSPERRARRLHARRSNGQTVCTRPTLDGTSERRLRAGYSPRWSPDGRTIACVTANRRIVIMRARRRAKSSAASATFGRPARLAPGRAAACVFAVARATCSSSAPSTSADPAPDD